MNSKLPRTLLPVFGSFLLFLAQAIGVEVTFQVDLTIQQAIARFDPDMDIIEVRGEFNGWSGGTELERDPNDPAIYSLPIELIDDPGAPVQYKFAIVDGNGVVIWEGFVGDGQDNRSFVQEETDHTLPLVFFDNLAENPGAGIDVTFLVDMAARIQDGLFDPEVDFVAVRGLFNNWEGIEPMTPVEEGSTIYQGTAKVDIFLPGSNVPYKFIINGTEWEGGENRQFELAEFAEQTQTVPVRFFDDVEPVEPVILGILRISPIIDGSFTLSWDSSEAILQGTVDFDEGWDDISDAAGQTEFTLTTALGPKLFFRLTAP